MKIIWYIIHTFNECPDEDLEWYKDKMSICKKCGRLYFKFNIY